jgi:hypothetical protein
MNACEEKRESHTRPFMAKEQPLFYLNGKIQHLQKENQTIHRIALIGDAGDADMEPGKSLMTAMVKRLNSLDTKETLVFLGDNIYQDGFQADEVICNSDSPESNKLDSQLSIGKASLNVSYFLPGNHDWDYHEEPNQEILNKQAKYLELCGRKTTFLPDGKNGSRFISSISNNLFTMLFFDSQALMIANKDQQKQTFDFIKGVFDISPTDKPIIIAAHHPSATYGPHGGCYQQDYFGHSIINFFRNRGYSWGQDINAKDYANYIKQLNAVIPEQHKVILVAGHDHSLQVINLKEGADYSIVSGAGSKHSPVCSGDDTLFAQEALGYIEIGFRKGGEITVEVISYKPEQNRLSKVYSQRLF